jgi:hypothetical protein
VDALTQLRVLATMRSAQTASTHNASISTLLRMLSYEDLVTYVHEVGKALTACERYSVEWFKLNKTYGDVSAEHGYRLAKCTAGSN